MKKILLAAMVLSFSFASQAQNDKQPGKEHKVVFQLMTDDTVVHKMLVKQLNNVLTAAPDTRIEVVCHGPGIYFLVTEKTIVHEKITQLKNKGVIFAACENTLRERNIAKDKIVAEAIFVPSGLVEIILKQEAGWSYIKAGF